MLGLLNTSTLEVPVPQQDKGEKYKEKKNLPTGLPALVGDPESDEIDRETPWPIPPETVEAGICNSDAEVLSLSCWGDRRSPYASLCENIISVVAGGVSCTLAEHPSSSFSGY